MSQGRILVVEDDRDTAEMLRIYFTEVGFAVEVCGQGTEVLSRSLSHLPDLIILDIMLPGMDGYAVCRELRMTTRTSHIPIIFLTQRDERSDRLAGLELGADDYVTKPFDLEELGLRVKNAITSHRRTNMTDPRTGLPAARLIEEQLRNLIRNTGWTYVEMAVQHMQPFLDSYGFVATDEVLRYTALLINQTLDQFGTPDDFVGHTGGHILVLITYSDQVLNIIDTIRQRFGEEIQTHYSFIDSEQGGIKQADGTLASIMSLSIGAVSSGSWSFSDIREITEAAAEQRRLDIQETVA